MARSAGRRGEEELSSPTARTLARLRAEGWTAGVTERWNAYAHIRQDLGGFIDVLAWAPERGLLAIQATTGTNVAARIVKLTALPSVIAWLKAPARLEIWGWRKAGERGKRKTWQVRKVGLQLDGTGRLCDFEL